MGSNYYNSEDLKKFGNIADTNELEAAIISKLQ
jgi:hypothetical protein